jgi:DNA topoisomerase IB
VLVDLADSAQAIADPKDAAESAGLRYVSDARPGIHRKKAGKGFTYTRADGSKLSEPDVLKRIRALAIPPAWTDVWICPWVDGHIQATGRDAKGRKQYRYHARFREVRESTKYEHVVAFADALPSIREKVREHMALHGLPREKVLATVVHLLESTLIRVGNDDYAKQNNSYGLTTLKNRHAAVDGNEVRFRFTGKSGKQWSLRVRDRRIAKIIKACQEPQIESRERASERRGKSQARGGCSSRIAAQPSRERGGGFAKAAGARRLIIPAVMLSRRDEGDQRQRQEFFEGRRVCLDKARLARTISNETTLLTFIR